MIQWREVSALAALALVPLAIVFFAWAFRRRERDLARFVESALLPSVAPDLETRRRNARAGMSVLAIALMALSLGGPMWGFRWQEVRSEGIDLVIALDTSKSMLATDVAPNRLTRAKLAIQDLLTELGGDRVALIAFAGTSFVQCPLTLDRDAFRESLESVEVGIIPRGGTNLPAAIASALDAFEGRQGNHQAIVLITDGESHEGNLDEALKLATDRGVKIFTVGIGTAGGELIPSEVGGYVKDRKGQVVKSRLDEETLEKIAIDTGGVYLHAAGVDLGLGALYRDHIETMDKRQLESTMERRYEQRFQLPLVAALFLMAAEMLVAERGKRRGSRNRESAT
jgi:Ca-activated chloride channel family protein